jgi:hypothetical protein
MDLSKIRIIDNVHYHIYTNINTVEVDIKNNKKLYNTYKIVMESYFNNNGICDFSYGNSYKEKIAFYNIGYKKQESIFIFEGCFLIELNEYKITFSYDYFRDNNIDFETFRYIKGYIRKKKIKKILE